MPKLQDDIRLVGQLDSPIKEIREATTRVVEAARKYANPDYEAAWRVWYQMNFWPWWMRWLKHWLRTPIKLMVDAALGITEDTPK